MADSYIFYITKKVLCGCTQNNYAPPETLDTNKYYQLSFNLFVHAINLKTDVALVPIEIWRVFEKLPHFGTFNRVDILKRTFMPDNEGNETYKGEGMALVKRASFKASRFGTFEIGIICDDDEIEDIIALAKGYPIGVYSITEAITILKKVYTD